MIVTDTSPPPTWFLHASEFLLPEPRKLIMACFLPFRPFDPVGPRVFDSESCCRRINESSHPLVHFNATSACLPHARR